VRVLIIEDNEKFRSILEGCLEPDGWDLALASTPAQALSHFRARPADVVLAEMDLKHGNGVDAVKGVRELPGGATVPVILMSSLYRANDEPVRQAVRELGIKDFVRKPFSVFDLRDQLARLAGDAASAARSPAPSAPTSDEGSTVPTASDPLDLENVRTIARLWSDRASGVLEVQQSPSHNDGFATLSQGGPLDAAGSRILHAALHGGTLAFTSGDAVGEGDHADLGAHLHEVLVHHANRRFLDDKGGWVLGKTSRYSATRSLPLSANARLLLGLLHEERPLQDLLEDLGLQASSVAQELECLCRLKLVEFVRRADDSAEDWDDEPSVVRKKVLERRRTRRRKDIPDGAAVVAPAPLRRETPHKAAERIAREIAAVRGQAPPVVLGLPRTAGRDIAQKAHARLRERYTAYLENPDLDRDAKALVIEMLELVDEALKGFEKRLEQWADPKLQRSEPQLWALVQEGRDLVFQERWKEAETALEKAQEMQLDNATVLGLLGWVRLHHPDYEEEERAADALDMLLLSEQFDMNNATGQYYLARYYFDRHEFQEAAPRIVRAAKALPKNPHIGQLMKQVKEAWNAPSVEIEPE
jgi:DNA-binding response OmpR family regulator/tetratricopeptide (TPR) repeat protein